MRRARFTTSDGSKRAIEFEFDLSTRSYVRQLRLFMAQFSQFTAAAFPSIWCSLVAGAICTRNRAILFGDGDEQEVLSKRCASRWKVHATCVPTNTLRMPQSIYNNFEKGDARTAASLQSVVIWFQFISAHILLPRNFDTPEHRRSLHCARLSGGRFWSELFSSLRAMMPRHNWVYELLSVWHKRDSISELLFGIGDETGNAAQSATEISMLFKTNATQGNCDCVRSQSVCGRSTPYRIRVSRRFRISRIIPQLHLTICNFWIFISVESDCV